jgi:YD repeat-containing protein
MNRVVVLLSLIIVVIASCSTNAAKETDLDKADLKGKVRNIEEIQYSAEEEFAQINKGEIIYRTLNEYNKKGNLSKKDEYIECIFEYHHDSDIYQYDEKGNLIESYNKQSYNKHRCYHTDSITEENTVKYQYDKKGSLIEENRYDTDSNLKEKTVYKYDRKENLIEIDKYDSGGKLYYTEICKYDRKKNLIENVVQEYNFRGVYNTTIYKCEYDKKGNLIEKNAYDSYNNLKDRNTYRYDEKGNLIERNYYYFDLNPLKYTYEYKYDNKANWIEQIQYKEEDDKSKQVITITERKIEYYEL